MAASVTSRVNKRREALRRSGLRPVQLWVADTRQPAFAEECRRQSASLRDDVEEQETLAWIEKASSLEGWE
jgi:Protein  of unknown function (DUF3018)